MLFNIVTISTICIVLVTAEEVVSTKYGKINGFLRKSSNGNEYYTFHKIPYAKPPVGKLRLQNPEPAEPWEGIRDGSLLPVKCPQADLRLFTVKNEVIFHGVEDCLYLSVYKPKESHDLPVMIFLHGGVFVSGSSVPFGAEEFLNENIVLVVINYRLGVLGFLSTEDEIIPGNFGLKDQLLAMKWTKENIQSFGGDSNKITVFGQSAGSFSAHYHILSSNSKGLFQRAILQSGTAICPWTKSKNHRLHSAQVGALVGCFTPASIGKKQSKELLECLQKADVKQLAMTFTNFMIWSYLPRNFGPYIDYNFIPDFPENLLKDEKYNNIDVIIGHTRNEGASFTFDMLNNNKPGKNMKKYPDYYGPISIGLSYENSSNKLNNKVFDYYLNGEYDINDHNAEGFMKLYSDRNYIICSQISALKQSEFGKKTNNRVYYYEFDFKGSSSYSENYDTHLGKEWIAHTEDLWYLFPGYSYLNKKRQRNDSEKKVSQTMIKLWTNFAATGNPTPDDSLGFTWDTYTKESPMHLSITENPKMKNDYRYKARDFWKSLPTTENELLYGNDMKKFKNEEL